MTSGNLSSWKKIERNKDVTKTKTKKSKNKTNNRDIKNERPLLTLFFLTSDAAHFIWKIIIVGGGGREKEELG